MLLAEVGLSIFKRKKRQRSEYRQLVNMGTRKEDIVSDLMMDLLVGIGFSMPNIL